MNKKKRAKHRSRRRQAQPFRTRSTPQLAVASDRTSASESTSGDEPVATFDPTPLQRKAERDQERRAWDRVDQAL